MNEEKKEQVIEKKRERVVETKPHGIKLIIRKFSRTVDKMDEEAEK